MIPLPLHLLLLWAAFICFVLVAVRAQVKGVDLVGVGLACWVLAVILGGR